MQIPQIAAFTEQVGIGRGLQVQLIAALVGLVAFVMALMGADFIVKIQMVIFIILSVSVAVILLSPVLPVSSDMTLFTGAVNMNGVGLSLGFWGAFAMFFPAVTGIDAGVGMSGQLKDARRSLSRGTFLAIGVTFVVYVLLTFVFSLMDPTGLIRPGNSLYRRYSCSEPADHAAHYSCRILFATGSSSSLISHDGAAHCPGTCQGAASAEFLNFLKYDFRKGGTEPRWATVFTFLLFMPIMLPEVFRLHRRLWESAFLPYMAGLIWQPFWKG